MASSKNLAYNLDYESSYVTTSPKKIIENTDNNSKISTAKKNFAINLQIKKRLAVKSKVAVLGTILLISGLFGILSYRYNVISEKNLKIQRLNIALNEVRTELTNAEIALSIMVDIEEIEAYAKQQLGMKEMSKNQIVYVETDTTTSIMSPDEETLQDKIANFFTKLFN